jgi:hypothetical protein
MFYLPTWTVVDQVHDLKHLFKYKIKTNVLITEIYVITTNT